MANPRNKWKSFALEVLHLAWVGISIDLIGSRVLPVIKIQVDIERFQCNSLDGAASRIQGFKDEVPTQK